MGKQKREKKKTEEIQKGEACEQGEGEKSEVKVGNHMC